MTSAPVRFSPDVEHVKPNEAETIERLCETFDIILERTAEDGGHAVRSVHAKAHGILEGTLAIDAGLPPELAQGLFAKPGEHKVYMRMSTNAGDILPDTISLPRGLALKVVGVDGERLPDAEGSNQDFIMVNGKVFQAPDTEAFAKNLKLLARTTDRIEGVKVATSKVLQGVNAALTAVGLPSTKLGSLGGAPNVDPLGETYYSLTPFRYGDYIAKFSVAPVAPALTELSGTKVHADGEHPNAIRETVQREMIGIEGRWEFRVQLCRDLEKQPVEDSTVEWKEDEAPFQRVGLITAAPQDSWAPAKVQAVDEEMRFSVWTGLAAHRPLGNINRARNAPYKHSAGFRQRFNKCPIHEPAAVS